MMEMLLDYWYLWLLILLAALLKVFMPLISGWFGEKTLSYYLKLLSPKEYKVLNDVILSTDSGTTQVNHIIVSLYGVFVIEAKTYTGSISGSEKSSQWSQNIDGKKTRLVNPLQQNHANVQAIKARLRRFSEVPIIPIVAFSPKCVLKVNTTSHVVYFDKVNIIIRSYTNKILSWDNVTAICSILQSEMDGEKMP